VLIDKIGFNERFWIHRDGCPHAQALHLVERISRATIGILHYEITIDDTATYTAPWSIEWDKKWTPNEELIEYFCQDNNISRYRMMGNESLVREPQ